MQFKYKYVLERRAKGFSQSEGQVNDQGLVLNGEFIPTEQILDTSSVDNRMVIAVADPNVLGPNTQKNLNDNSLVIIEVKKTDVELIEKELDRHTSKTHAERYRQALIASGQGSRFKATECPHCHSTVETSQFKNGLFTYCKYCESIFDQQNQVISNGDSEKLCFNCNMWDTVDSYNVFFFYFIVVAYGWRVTREHLCNHCAVKRAKNVLLKNLPFVLGIVPALIMWGKAARSDKKGMKGLAKANRLALKGDYQAADQIFNEILQQYPHHPAVLRNMAHGHWYGKDNAGYKQILQMSVDSAPSYQPVSDPTNNLLAPAAMSGGKGV